MASKNETIIKVVACRKVFTGRNGRGDMFSIYEIEAHDKQGSLITQQLRSFEALPMGEPIEVTVTPFDSAEYGKSYTVHPKNAQNPSNDAQYRAMATTVEQLKATVTTLGQSLRHLQDQVDALQFRSSREIRQ